MDEQCVPAARRGFLVRKRAHDALRVVQREARDRHALEERVDVALEHRCPSSSPFTLRLTWSGYRRASSPDVQRSPTSRNVTGFDGSLMGRASAEQTASMVRRTLSSGLPSAASARVTQEGPRDVVGYVRAAKVLSDVGEHGAACFRGLLGRAGRQREFRPRGRVERDPGVPVVALLVGVPCSLAGHGLSWGWGVTCSGSRDGERRAGREVRGGERRAACSYSAQLSKRGSLPASLAGDGGCVAAAGSMTSSHASEVCACS